MGGGASTSQAWANSIFANPHVLDGLNYLSGDDRFRFLFLKYVNNKDWVARLEEVLTDAKLNGKKSNSKFISQDNCWLGYAMDEDAMDEFTMCSTPATSPTANRQMSKRGKSFAFAHMPSSRSFAFHPEKSFDMAGKAEPATLSQQQLTAIMLSILYPLFASTSDDEDNSMRTNAAYFNPGQKLSRIDSSPSEKPEGARAQDLLRACCDYFTTSPAELDEVLQSSNWVETAFEAIQNTPLGVTICDTTLEGSPIIFANTAFKTMTGYKRSEMKGKNFAMLHGASTELGQAALLEDAVKNGYKAKIAITYHHKKQKAFLDLVAVRACAQYSVAVHFAATKHSRQEDLLLVDDLLVLLACMIEAPLHHPSPAPGATGAASTNSSAASLSRAGSRANNNRQYSRGASSRFFSSGSVRFFSRPASPEDSLKDTNSNHSSPATSRHTSLRQLSNIFGRSSKAKPSLQL